MKLAATRWLIELIQEADPTSRKSGNGWEPLNSSLKGNTRRAIDLRKGEKINEVAFKQLIRAAVAANSAARAERAAKRT